MTSKTIIRLGGYGPSTTTHSRGLKYIGDSLQSLFGNRVDIKYIWNVMDLGYGSDAVLWLTECGMIDIVYMSTTALTSRVQDLEILDLPFLFSDLSLSKIFEGLFKNSSQSCWSEFFLNFSLKEF